MPTNKKESLIYTVLMCAFMVYVMTVYNIVRVHGFSSEVFLLAWMGFPLAYVVGIICDWFIVSGPAKGIAFSILTPESSNIKKIITVSTCMVCGMVLLMSLYGAYEAVGFTSEIFIVWLFNIPFNFVVALPLQLLVAGPIVRFVFRKLFPVGTIVA